MKLQSRALKFLSYLAVGLWFYHGTLYLELANAGTVYDARTGAIFPAEFNSVIRYTDEKTFNLYRWSLYGALTLGTLSIVGRLALIYAARRRKIVDTKRSRD